VVRSGAAQFVLPLAVLAAWPLLGLGGSARAGFVGGCGHPASVTGPGGAWAAQTGLGGADFLEGLEEEDAPPGGTERDVPPASPESPWPAGILGWAASASAGSAPWAPAPPGSGSSCPPFGAPPGRRLRAASW
jgi:hypothetical protein